MKLIRSVETEALSTQNKCSYPPLMKSKNEGRSSILHCSNLTWKKNEKSGTLIS